MPVVQCQCGSTTNSAVSDYWEQLAKGGKRASYCLVAWINGKWEKGCGFDKADVASKKFALELIEGSE